MNLRFYRIGKRPLLSIISFLLLSGVWNSVFADPPPTSNLQPPPEGAGTGLFVPDIPPTGEAKVESPVRRDIEFFPLSREVVETQDVRIDIDFESSTNRLWTRKHGEKTANTQQNLAPIDENKVSNSIDPQENNDESKTRKLSCTRKFVDFFATPFQCSSAQLGNLYNFCFNSDYLNPAKCTSRRAVGCLGLSTLTAGAGVLFWQYGPDVFRDLINSFAFFVAVNGGETALDFTAAVFARPPAIEPTPKNRLRELAVIIPVHGKTKDIEPTLISLIKAGIEADQIFVMENTNPITKGGYTQEESKTYSILSRNKNFIDVHYYFINKWGSKVASEYLGTVVAKSFNFKYAMAIDDDVIMADDFSPYLELIQGPIKLIAYPIVPSNNVNCITHHQKIEYERADRVNYLKQVAGTVLAPHGAISTFEIDAYLDVMRTPPVDGAFFAEDQKKGAATRWSGFRIAMAPGAAAKTEVPSTVAEHMQQRCKSWNPGEHLSTGIYVQDMMADTPKNCDSSEVTGTLLRKACQLQTLASIVSDCVRPFIMVSNANSPLFWQVTGAICAASCVIGVTDEVCCKPIRSREESCLLRPQPKKLCQTCGHHLCATSYRTLLLAEGTTGAVCAWVGAGASRPEDVMILRPYPNSMKKILEIPNKGDRFQKLMAYLDEMADQKQTEQEGLPGDADFAPSQKARSDQPEFTHQDLAGPAQFKMDL